MSIGSAYNHKAYSNGSVGLLDALSLPKHPVDAHKMILEGLCADIVIQLSGELHVDEMTICQWAGISRATYTRKIKPVMTAFSVHQSCKLYQLVRVLDAAIELFNDDIAAATKWLNTPSRDLGGDTPVHMLSTMAGTEAVLDLIGRIELGVVA